MNSNFEILGVFCTIKQLMLAVSSEDKCVILQQSTQQMHKAESVSHLSRFNVIGTQCCLNFCMNITSLIGCFK